MNCVKEGPTCLLNPQVPSTPLKDAFCRMEPCPYGYSCMTHPADQYAVCCQGMRMLVLFLSLFSLVHVIVCCLYVFQIPASSHQKQGCVLPLFSSTIMTRKRILVKHLHGEDVEEIRIDLTRRKPAKNNAWVRSFNCYLNSPLRFFSIPPKLKK